MVKNMVYPKQITVMGVMGKEEKNNMKSSV